MAWLASGLSSFSVFRSCINASLYVTEKSPLLLNIDQYKEGCYLKHNLGGLAALSLSPFIVCV